MIRHDYEIVHGNIGAYLRRASPFGFDNRAYCVKSHCTIDNFAKQTLSILNTERHEVHPSLAIVEFS